MPILASLCFNGFEDVIFVHVFNLLASVVRRNLVIKYKYKYIYVHSIRACNFSIQLPKLCTFPLQKLRKSSDFFQAVHYEWNALLCLQYKSFSPQCYPKLSNFSIRKMGGGSSDFFKQYILVAKNYALRSIMRILKENKCLSSFFSVLSQFFP